ncbi:hypothetical protein B0H11DRAFT_521801 [Mycena galericulata]|nr:hypothetical protein B0H11DRAFT_521801 [Mycena galericulata]
MLPDYEKLTPCCPSTMLPATSRTAECTSKCVIVACTDDAPVCDGVCPGNHCDLVCEDATNCNDCNGFDEFCCTDFHSYYEEPRNHPETASGWSWDPSLKTFVCSCGGKSMADIPPDLGADSPLFAPTDDFSTAVDVASSTASYSTPSPRAVSEVITPQLACMWADCGASFDQLSALAEHVNSIHLRHPPAPAPPASSDASDPFSMSCRWKDCTEYPTPDSVPGPSSGDIESMLGVLSSHLFHDHLGLNSLPTYLPPQSSELPLPGPHPAVDDPAVLPSEDEGHVCRWAWCGQSFGSIDELTIHLTNVHVGTGKTSYDCFWQDCPRHDENGFTSKQKLCRHLQSHTGHRPFQCKTCLQNFSEAATLQQHMRRHTQEKPYVCDHPGCGKSFAITGALTIHKRTHNGDRPFKCPHCEKAFSESSNLSKHLRTHTGARPYTCGEPGCNKSFARADQLTRHARVHKKVSAS